MQLDKGQLNLAGEYRVASELFKRGLFATITYGNMKGIDIFAIGANQKTTIIEVKASQTRRFVTGFYQKYKSEGQKAPNFWVLCSFGLETERLFVLSHKEMAIVQGFRNAPNKSLTHSEHALKAAKGVDNVPIALVEPYEDAWHKIVEYCNA